MGLHLDSLLDSLGRDSLAFLPELLLCGAIVLLLLLRLFSFLDRLHLGGLALIMTLVVLTVSVAQWRGRGLPTPESHAESLATENLKRAEAARPLDLFAVQRARADLVAAQEGNAPEYLKALPAYNGLVVYDRLTLFVRIFLFAFTALVIWLSLLTGIPDREDSGDFYVLLLGAALGMALMASANHLLMIYLAVEMASLPCYALAGFLKGRTQSSEAALKYVVYGGGASGVMLYGISLLAGKFGTAYLPDLAVGFVAAMSPGGHAILFDPILVMGTLFIMIGLAFKLSAVPFHFWCPDVFEGAAAEVAGFLSVASKGAALALTARLVFTLAGLSPLVGQVPDWLNWMGMAQYLVPALAFFAALTATFGNLAAYQQNNLKRLLAYSTIAHAGYMLMGLATLTREGVAAVLFYLIAYLVMNLGAFAIVAFLRNQTGSEDLTDFRGLVRQSPWMVVTLSLCLLSLLGMPPLVGFTAKFQIFQALFHAGQDYTELHQPGLATTMYVLLGIGGLNTVLSAVYYIKVMKVMILDTTVADVEGREPAPYPEPTSCVVYAVALSLALFVLGVLANPVMVASQEGARGFAAHPKLPAEVKEARR